MFHSQKELSFSELNPYPDSFRLFQYITLKSENRELYFQGYLVMNKKNDFRALALGELGGKFFDFGTEDGQIKVLQTPPGFPDKLLIKSVINDIQHIYSKKNFDDAYITSKGNAFLNVMISSETPKYTLYYFKNKKLLRSEEIDHDKIIRSADYTNHKNFTGSSIGPIPEEIILKNTKWNYELRIKLLKFQNISLPEKLFSTN